MRSKFAYDDDSTWPLEWYLRDYNKRAYYGENPSRETLDAPVVIAGDKNLLKVRPYLGDRFYEFNYRLVWWPRESYRDITPARILEILRDPVERGHVWDIIVHRRYTLPTVQWDPVHRFSLFVRKDVAAQVWNWGGVPAGATVSAGAEDYLQKQRDVASVQQLGQTGVPGTGPGQFNNPRAVTVGPDGEIYVADSGNHRIQVFSPDGRPLRQFGSMCKLIDRNLGCQGDGRGQFNEPWGIAVSADGSIFVADTWNSRIQKFGRNGNFIQMWGNFESTGGELGKPNALYGPRSLVIGKDGNLYVMDTGNKRVQVFTQDGAFVAQYGGGGVVEGRFEEATGLAQDAQGNWYVADTWNQRIQKFDSSFGFTDQWPINGWATMNATNKPFLAVDSARGLIYATDPENYRVLVFGLEGDFRYTFGLYGRDNMSFSLPTGLALAPDGKLYVADGDAHRVMVFQPPGE